MFLCIFKTPAPAKESLHEVVGFCFMNLTCDKTASVSMYEHGVIPKMLEFISTPEHYTDTSVRAALHAMANIGIHSAKAKESMFGELRIAHTRGDLVDIS